MDGNAVTHSKVLKTTVIVIGVLLIILVSFAGGLAVGLKKAKFSYAFGENYERNFMNGPRGKENGRMPLPDPDAPGFHNGHGLIGKIISIADGSIVVKDRAGVESTVSLSDQTSIKSGRNDIRISDLASGDTIAVIGKPSENGSVNADFIRVLVGPGENDK